MDSTGQGLGLIYNTAQAGYSALATGNNNLISAAVNLQWAQKVSLQILSDGGAIVNYTLQVTNLPSAISNSGVRLFNSPTRDDTYASNQWSTVTTGVLAKNVGVTQGAMMTISGSVYGWARLLFNWDATNTAGSTANLFAITRTVGN